MDIIFVEPQYSANIGHLARAMKNFDFKNLILVNPQCPVQDIDSLRIAKHAEDIVKKAKIMKSFDAVLSAYDYVFATSANVNTDYNILRSPTDLDIVKRLAKTNRRTALVFGREGSGLTNEEVKKCDGMITIPTSVNYPVMNISHAAAIVLYELFKDSKKKKVTDKIAPIKQDVKRALLREIYSTLDFLSIDAKKKQIQKLLWRKIIGKGLLTNREAMALFGFFKKVK